MENTKSINIEIVKDYLELNGIKYDRDVSLKKKTWIKTGGLCSYWINPKEINDFIELVTFLQTNKISFKVVGATSNCFFKNTYNPEIIISTLKLKRYRISDDIMECEPGLLMSSIANLCINNGYSKYEGFIGLPGTVAGAAINNAGCFGSLISDVVLSIDIIKDGEIISLSNDMLKYQHRNSIIKKNIIDCVVIRVRFDVSHKDDSNVLRVKAKKFQEIRTSTQEYRYRTLGSTFAGFSLVEKPYFKYIFIKLFIKFLNVIRLNSVLIQKITTKIILLVYRAPKNVKENVSNYWVGCYTWKNAESEKSFDDYCDFIRRISKIKELEIEVEN